MHKDHYSTLGVSRDAGEAEIRTAYKKLARMYHPDKRGADLNANPQNESYDEVFSTITQAYEILGDASRRAEYDLSLGQGNLEAVLELQRKDAERASQLMAVSFDQRRKSELSCGGLVVDDAWYGASEAVLHPEKHASQVINVTRQLQCLVDNSKLVIAKGDAKSHLTGVWDPCPGNSHKALRVNYFFKGKLHQTMVRDDEMLLAPVKAHLVAGTKPFAGAAAGGRAKASANRHQQLVQAGPPAELHRASTPAAVVAVRGLSLLGLAVVFAGRGWVFSAQARAVAS
jgi:DnaJ-domain-containing protein 1